jgi:hypothetical protein
MKFGSVISSELNINILRFLNKENNHFEDLEVDERILLKQI